MHESATYPRSRRRSSWADAVPTHEGVGRHGKGVSVAEKERGSGRDETGGSRVSHKGATATHRVQNWIRALANANESLLHPVQTTRDLGDALDVPRIVVKNLQHDAAEVATTAARPSSEVRALEKGRACYRRACRTKGIFGFSYRRRGDRTRLSPAEEAIEVTGRQRTSRPTRGSPV